ncbi:MAG: type I secretion C-terminal target domain-containing protein, partial [Gammaproteobacteria bacterium]
GIADLSNTDQFILEASDGTSILWRLTVDKVEGVTPGGQIGDYNFELFNNIDHPLDNLAFGDDVLEVQFSYTVTSPGGSESGSLTIDINDDRPDTVQVIADVGDAPIVTNLVVVLDRSGSMNNHPGGDTSAPTRLELAKSAIADLLSAWSELGMVNVMVVDFANSATHATDGATNDPWLTADQANIYVQGITANSVTNYQLAAEEVISLFPGGSDPGAGTPPEADQSYVYWLTDGVPNRGNLNESSWTDFLLREDFTAAYGVGVGRDISAMDPDLQEVAWPNDTEFSAVNPDGNLIVVGDARDLGDTLVSTVVNRVEGNIVDEGLPDSTYGADGPGLLVSLSVDGITYTYDPAGDGTITPDDGGSAIAGSILSVDTPLGGNLIFDFSSGDYSYAIPQVAGVESETFTYSVVDAEGDQTATPNEFIIRVHEVDEVINGTASSDILTGGAGDELIIGRGGDDTINGGDGSDAIRGGPGSDNLTGGSGADTFIFRSLSEGVDTILDYNSDESDVLDISDILAGFEPGVDTIEDFVNVATDGTLAVNPNPSEPGSSFTDIAVLANISPGTTIIVQVTEDATETYMVMS